MYYIIETKEQLEKFYKYNLKDSFVHAILSNDKVHPVLAEVVAYYIKPVQSRLGFILPINHSESLNLDGQSVLDLISNCVETMWVYDEKQASYHLPTDAGVKSIKMAQWLKDGKVLDIDKYNTPIQNSLYNKHADVLDLNRSVPLSKLCEKYDNFVVDNNRLITSKIFNEEYYEHYSALTRVFFQLECTGIPVNSYTLKRYYTLDNKSYSIKSGRFYSDYNLYTQTGRPSNTFNGVNFGAIPKGDATRSFIVPKNTKLVEFDYKSYHPNILAKMIDYHFGEDDIHTHLGRLYFDTDTLTEQQYDDSKKLTFKHLYTNSKDNTELTFFTEIKDLRERLWKRYRKDGHITSELSGRPLKGIESTTQILPYLLQNYETERNAVVMAKIMNYLDDKNTKLVLYNYDSFLLDWAEEDGIEVLEQVQAILEKGGYKTTCSYGKDYSSLKNLNV